MGVSQAAAGLSRWELAAETIAVKIRWFGLLVGYALVNLGTNMNQRILYSPEAVAKYEAAHGGEGAPA